jgi:hypothetical protein
MNMGCVNSKENEGGRGCKKHVCNQNTLMKHT